MKRNAVSIVKLSALALTLTFGLVLSAGRSGAAPGGVQQTGKSAPRAASGLEKIPDAAVTFAKAADAGPADGVQPFKGTIALYVGSPNALVNGGAVTIDGNPAVTPYIDNSRTMMPLRFVAAAMGFNVEWREAEKAVILTRSGLRLEFALGSKIMVKNGQKITMDAAAAVSGGRTFVPIAYVADAMGLKVAYDRGLILLDSERAYDAVADKAFITSAIGKLSGLPFVGGKAEFNELMKELATEDALANRDYGIMYDDVLLMAPETAAPRAEASANAPAATSAPAEAPSVNQSADKSMADTAEAGHSETNVQVQGVDEADIIKTDGRYIYHLSGGRLNIVKADGAGNMEKAASLDFDGNRDNFYPNDMYVDGNRLTVIGVVYPDWDVYTRPAPAGEDKETPKADYYAPYYMDSFVRVQVYDVGDKSRPALKREFSVEGSLLSSRKIGGDLYLVVNKSMYFYGAGEPSDEIPLYSVKKDGGFTALDFGGMRYFPGDGERGMLMICGIDTVNDAVQPKINSIIGSGGDVYMSLSSLYIAKHNYGFSFAPSARALDFAAVSDYADKSSFFKFALDGGDVVFSAVGAADGAVLNQYSMDEYNGYFRVATTVGGSAKNALTVFRPNMEVAGKIDDMAPGERIYSARFMGDRAYMVTYRTVDPLFAIDLSQPSSPKVLGELKIPGYSSYLHPYDETRLIGFGRDTEEMTTKDSKGNVVNSWAVNKGLKLSLFDVSDITKPKEIDVVSIGNEYADSELLHNPKALLFSKEKGFIAFPVRQYPNESYDGGKFDAFIGAYVYNISPSGFSLRGTITQDPGNAFFSRGYDGRDDPSIQRVIYIGGTFYSASGMGLQANAMSDLKYVGFVKYGK